jgi:hypothetical protein
MKRRTLLVSVVITAVGLLLYLEVHAQEPGYVGSSKCAQCHGAKYESYQQTWHANILRPANDQTVIGDFDSTDRSFGCGDVDYVVGGQFSQRYLAD